MSWDWKGLKAKLVRHRQWSFSLSPMLNENCSLPASHALGDKSIMEAWGQKLASAGPHGLFQHEHSS